MEITIVYSINYSMNNFIVFPIVIFYIASRIGGSFRGYYRRKLIAAFIEEGPFIIIHKVPFLTACFTVLNCILKPYLVPFISGVLAWLSMPGSKAEQTERYQRCLQLMLW